MGLGRDNPCSTNTKGARGRLWSTGRGRFRVSLFEPYDARAKDQASGCTTTLTFSSTSACSTTCTSNSPTRRSGPSPITTSLFSSGRPAAVNASAMSRVLTEPNSLPSAEALAVMVTELPSSLALRARSEEHTSELQSLMRISYAVFCLKKKKKQKKQH